jgi:hypothetical protein
LIDVLLADPVLAELRSREGSRVDAKMAGRVDDLSISRHHRDDLVERVLFAEGLVETCSLSKTEI